MADTKASFRITGWHVLFGVTFFFLVVIGVNVVFTVMALRTFPGQVSVTPYEDGIVYNRTIAQHEAQQRLGWRAAASVEAGVITVRIVDRADQAVSGLSVTGLLQRPATETGANSPRFTETTPGVYQARTEGLDGAWDLSFTAKARDGRIFTGERRLMWR